MQPNPSQVARILANVRRLVTPTAADERVLTSTLSARRFRRRQYVLQEGDVCRNETYVVKGCLRAYHIDRNGFDHVVQFAIEDWWVSDMASFLLRAPATLTIDALEDTEVLQIARADYDRLLIEAPVYERYFRLLLQNAFIASQNRVLDVISHSAEERYLALRQRYPQFERRIPQKHLAAYLGVTPEFLSRLRARLARKPRSR